MNKKLDTNTVERSLTDYMYKYLPSKIENMVSKFHQSGNFTLAASKRHKYISEEVLDWAYTIENTDTLPSYYENTINLLPINRYDKISSNRALSKDKQLTLEHISHVLYNAFGRGKASNSKQYPSAGALYPVMPLLLIFKEQNYALPGVYAYNEKSNQLLQIKSWSSKEALFIKKDCCMFTETLSDTCIAYSIDMRKALFKYRYRGYRHALIEIGAMTQCFKECLHQLDTNLAEVSWSGFNDNQLTYLSGLNVKLAPITLLQWFGYAEGK